MEHSKTEVQAHGATRSNRLERTVFSPPNELATEYKTSLMGNRSISVCYSGSAPTHQNSCINEFCLEFSRYGR